MRPTWNEYFMLMAKTASLRSTCNSRPTGAVIVKERQIVSTGYNGSISGAENCSDGRAHYCYRRNKSIPDAIKNSYCPSSHAEANAIAFAAKRGICIHGSAMYTTLAPCFTCMKLIVMSGIRSVFYELDYTSESKERDIYWKSMNVKSGIYCYQKMKISEDVSIAAAENIVGVTSNRRLS